MTNEVSTNLTFEQKIEQKLKENIGDQIDAASMKKLIDTGIEKFMFNARHNGQGYSKPSLMEELIDKHLKEILQVQIQTWLAENPERVQAVIKQQMETKMDEVILRALGTMFTFPLENMYSQLMQNLRSRGMVM